MTTITPPTMPVHFDETGVEREGAYAYVMGRSFDQHIYGEHTRAAMAFKRGWFMAKREVERDASNA